MNIYSVYKRMSAKKAQINNAFTVHIIIRKENNSWHRHRKTSIPSMISMLFLKDKGQN